MQYVLYALIVVLVVILISCIKVVPQAQAFVLERLGGYQATWGVGVHLSFRSLTALPSV